MSNTIRADTEELILWVLNNEELYNLAHESGISSDDIGDEASPEFMKWLEENKSRIISTIKSSTDEPSAVCFG